MHLGHLKEQEWPIKWLKNRDLTSFWAAMHSRSARPATDTNVMPKKSSFGIALEPLTFCQAPLPLGPAKAMLSIQTTA